MLCKLTTLTLCQRTKRRIKETMLVFVREDAVHVAQEKQSGKFTAWE
jgi:hypothetical protein